MAKRLALLLACILAGCDPKFSPTGVEFGLNDPPPPIEDPEPENPCANALANGNYEFSISRSFSNPEATSGDVSPGPLDLYLWLKGTDLGLSALEFDIQRDGANLPENYFTPAGDNLFLTWEGSGEVDLAVAGCPRGSRLLGTIHLEVIAESIQVSMLAGSTHAGAVDCGPCYLLHSFQCEPFVGH